MTTPARDDRSPQRRALDEQIAGEPLLGQRELPPGAVARPIEGHLGLRHRPEAVAGVVENGLVRPLDPAASRRNAPGHHRRDGTRRGLPAPPSP